LKKQLAKVLIAFAFFFSFAPTSLRGRGEQSTAAQASTKTLTVPGLRDPVTVRRDERGIPYIEAKNDADLYFAQGYVIASDRLWQMDLLRRNERGELAEVLGNAIERAVLVCDTNVIHSHHLPPTLQTAEASGTGTRMTLASAIASFERDLIVDTLKSTSGNIAKAARQLESTERILGYKIKKYGIDSTRFRQ